MNGKQIEFPEKQTHVKGVRVRDDRVLDHLHDHRPDHRARYQHRGRDPSDRLSGAEDIRSRGSSRRSRMTPDERPGRTRAQGRCDVAAGARRWSLLLVPHLLRLARSCQQSQIRVSQSEAIATANAQIDFKPTRHRDPAAAPGLSTEALLVRRPVDPIATADPDTPARQVHIDANTGKVTPRSTSDPAAGRRQPARPTPSEASALSRCGYSSSSTSPASTRASSRR